MILNASAENGSVVAGPSLFHFLADLADNWRQIERRREIVDDCVEHRLHALVTERTAEQHRSNRNFQGGGANRGANLFRVGMLAFEVQLHDVLVVIGERLDILSRYPLACSFRSAGISSTREVGAETIFVPE